MRISEAASTSGLSIDTIRYYEKTALLPPVKRGADGKRRFSPGDVDWLVLLSSLRDTGMRMETMRYFALLYQRGDETIPERKRILLGHSEQLDKQRKGLDRCAEILARKLKRYDEIAAS